MGRLLVSSAIDSEDGLPPALTNFHVVAVGDHFVAHLQTEDGQRMAVLIRSFDDAAWLQHEASQALAAMISSVRNAPYPARQFAEVIRRAARPDVQRSHVRFNPAAEQFNYHLHFPRRAPISMTLTDADIDIMRAKQQAARSIARADR
ncbi:hypothetical protein CN135_24545 [Sinorhizobium meliloti]|nr:hypothetical protein [Sinorhizobium meliloti]MDW9868767.1 hypothetical protein [Sinorhizobium meliloti]RVG48985.1 hypothetical protein CN224_30345 [Sinorhizobium meliloti]RVL75727.1 hypothetical protein CN135_24545 [Sinorhizobium meliloti]RVN78165.1 hypothetical protein CN105_31990 [Sinorhizobium meliloti]